MVHAWNPKTRKTKVGGLRVRGQSGICMCKTFPQQQQQKQTPSKQKKNLQTNKIYLRGGWGERKRRKITAKRLKISFLSIYETVGSILSATKNETQKTKARGHVRWEFPSVCVPTVVWVSTITSCFSSCTKNTPWEQSSQLWLWQSRTQGLVQWRAYSCWGITARVVLIMELVTRLAFGRSSGVSGCEWLNERWQLHKILQGQLLVEEIHLGIILLGV